MKILIFILSMSLLTSCGKKATETAEKSQSGLQEESSYGLPKVGFQKSVNLNYRFEHSYENMTFDPSGDKEVLGDRPFFLFLNEDNSIELNFYSKTNLKSVGYLDLGNKFEVTQIKNLSDISMHPDFKPMTDFYRVFTYGKANLDSPLQDMLNKVFVVETEHADLPYIGRAKIMFWITCNGGFTFKNKNEYLCGDGKLAFNYKLLDYVLTK